MSESPKKRYFTALLRIEPHAACLVVVGSVILHLVFLLHAGALWRDEAGGVQLATLPQLSEVWRWNTHDSFPMFFSCLVRIWAAVGFGHTDLGLRILGFIMGCGLLGALWLGGRLMGLRLPILALAMLGTNLTVIRWGDSVRAYACGSIFIILTMGLVWRHMREVRTWPWTWTWLAASAAALLSAQTLYSNAFLLAGICIAGATVCFLRRQPAIALSVLAIGAPAAFSLVPYIRPIAAARDFYILQTSRLEPGFIWEAFSFGLGTPILEVRWVWLAFVALAVALGIRSIRRTDASQGATIDSADAPLFCALTILAGSVGFFCFLKLTGLAKPWYFIPLMALAALCVDTALRQISDRLRTGVVAAALLVSASQIPGSAHYATYALSNMDAVADEVRNRAAPGDLVLVYPWYFGISFSRYYMGTATWLTLPEVSDHRFHRFDLVKLKMTSPAPIQPVLDQVRQTLQSGHRLWFVANTEPLPSALEDPLPPAPAPGSPEPWSETLYTKSWGRELEHFLERNAGQVESLGVVSRGQGRLVGIESPELIAASGWKNNKP